MAGIPERKIRFLGSERRPSTIGLWGVFLTLAGVWAGNEPCIAIPAVLVGSSLVVYSNRKMGQQERGTPPK